MKKIQGLLLCGGLLFNYLSANAQSPAESALLFSRTNPGGSARVQAMGGAQVSLGGDYSSAFSNPAGLGMYNRSEITLSPGFSTSSSTANLLAPYTGSTQAATQSRPNVQGFSIVIHTKKKEDSKTLGGTLGISLTRTNDFNSSFSYSGVNPANTNNSIIDHFLTDANNHSAGYGGLGQGDLFYATSGGYITSAGLLFETPTRLAYDNYIVNPNAAPDSTHYGSDVPASGNSPTMYEVVKTKGSQNQLNVSYGVNLNDKVFVGGGIGLGFINYQTSRTYAEAFPSLPLNSIVLAESMNTSTTTVGINATFGTIYRPLDFLQLGASIATPTYYSLQDNYNSALSSDWNASAFHSLYGSTTAIPQPSAIDTYPVNYALTTPWRFNGGATFFIQKRGFITADIEYLNYASSHYSSISFNSDTDLPNQRYFNMIGDNYVQGGVGGNTEIKSLFKSVVNVRLGGEYRLNKFRVRAGYSLMPDPYKSSQNAVNAKIQSFSVGAGYRGSKFFVDIAAVQKQASAAYRPYSPYGGLYPESGPIVQVKSTLATYMVTVGYILPAREARDSRPARVPGRRFMY